MTWTISIVIPFWAKVFKQVVDDSSTNYRMRLIMQIHFNPFRPGFGIALMDYLLSGIGKMQIVNLPGSFSSFPDVGL